MVEPESMMLDVLEVAEEAVRRGEAPIGAVLFDASGRRVAQGWNQRRSTGDSTRHAEMVAFAAAAQPGKPADEGLILVCNLEPCVMCWGAALNLSVSRIVFGLEAPLDGGLSRITDKERGVPSTGGVLRNDCRALFETWLNKHGEAIGADYVRQLLNAT